MLRASQSPANAVGISSKSSAIDAARNMDKAWEVIQKKTFTKWVNNKLDVKQVPHISDLIEDLANGERLIQLLEIIGDTSLGRYNKQPKLRIKCVENVHKALEFIKERGLGLTNIGAEDIVDKNVKLVLGMLWTLILRFAIADINEDGKNAKEGLLLWCQRKTAPYNDVDVRDFTHSWSDGLAFCALIHRHYPDLLDYDEWKLRDARERTSKAFEVAEQHLGIPKLLDVEDVCDIAKPDERSIMTYVAEYFHAFSALDMVDTAGRRIAKFAEVVGSVWQMKHDYERRVKKLMSDMHHERDQWNSAEFTDSYDDTKEMGAVFTIYKKTTKREWVKEKGEVNALLGNIQTKLKTYNLRPYDPPEGLTLMDLDDVWHALLDDEAVYHRNINSKIREIKENLRKAYAQVANDCEHRMEAISSQLSMLTGDLDGQLASVMTIAKKKIAPLKTCLAKVADLDKQCLHANTEENDYTVYSVEDLAFGLQLLREAIQKKQAFIQNQLVARRMTNLTPAQLEEFEQTFRHFDEETSNTLCPDEFRAAIASLGISYADEKFEQMFIDITEGEEQASFEQFIRFMVQQTEDKSTPEQLCESFRMIAGEKPYVTELDLKQNLVPEKAIEHLRQEMPMSDAQGAYDYNLYVEQVFQS